MTTATTTSDDLANIESLGQLLRHWSTERPEAPALTEGETTRSWGELATRARRMSAALAVHGVAPGTRVGYLEKNDLTYFDVLFGCVLMGAVSVAVNWRLSPAEMTVIVEDSTAPIVFFGPEFADAVAHLKGAPPDVVWVPLSELDAWLDTHAPGDASDPGFEPEPDDVVTQLYTSGTTGLPKGAMITAKNFRAVLTGAVRKFRIDAETVSLIAMPVFHIGGTGWAVGGMSQGGHSVIIRDVDPAEMLRLIETHAITATFIVPAVLMFLLAMPQLATTDVSSLRTIFYGAAPISEDLLTRSMAALGCDFAQVYGLTETTGTITSLIPEDHDPGGPRSHLLRSAGRPVDGVELRIVDTETGATLPPGVVGEIWVRCDQVMLGYWNKPNETSATMSEEWFRTGDAGWLDDEGYLFLHDRIKDMIVSGGENVYPAEVENALLSHPLVTDAAVIGVPHEKWGETVKAIVVLHPDAPGDDQGREDLAREIIGHSRELLAHYKCPTSIDFIDLLPRNPSGKVLKRELRAPYWADRTRNIS